MAYPDYTARLYSGDKTEDIQYIWEQCQSHFEVFDMPWVDHLHTGRSSIKQIVCDMYSKFPGNLQKASLFKRVAWFATCFLYYRPLKQPLPRKVTRIQEEQNAVVALNIASESLIGAKLFRSDGITKVIPTNPILILSRHSYTDIIDALVGWERHLKKQPYDLGNFKYLESSIDTFYKQLALLIEQVTYRAYPYLSYPPMSSSN